ncbi:MAG: YicC/YloC family endoribonuclease [Planctomycetota bacterium]
MTGYGRARVTRGALAAEVEARSVNGRGLQLRCRVPADRLSLEPQFEALTRKLIERGHVELQLRVSIVRRRSPPQVDRRLLARYRAEAARLGGGEPALLMALPGVIRTAEPEASPGVTDELALSAARRALAALVTARRAEGARLRQVLLVILRGLARQVAALRRRAPAALRRQQEQLSRRVAELLHGERLSANDPGLRRELALLADKSDILEELDRLESHLQALQEALAQGGAVGRRLEFLLQEVGRELNTVGSKSSDSELVAHVVEAKLLAERLREQAANFE